jgi:hypothetical protein
MTHPHNARTTPPASPQRDLASRIDDACASLRTQTLSPLIAPPPLESHMKAPTRRLNRPALVGLATLMVAGVAFGGYTYISRSWSADVSVRGKEVRVTLDGQLVAPEKVEWLPDGNCLVTVNGARILLDPRQPGGANASISVQQSTDDKPLIPVQGVPLTDGSN